MHRSIAAYQNLVRGNERFTAGDPVSSTLATRERRDELVAGQNPSAIILGCSDSRVPAEIIFDQGLGELFVIRVAGNVAAQEGIGSIEYAVENCGTRLVVVLGHSCCGAVQATVNGLREGEMPSSPNLKSIVEKIAPAVSPLLESGDSADLESLVDQAVKANVKNTVNDLLSDSPVLQHWMKEDNLVVVGANYSLESGQVEFFDVPPGAET
jgi:carbonic anhydrase